MIFNKLPRLDFIILLLLFTSCVGSDLLSCPESISESKQRNILINTYQPSNNIVKIGNGVYHIEECWTTYKFVKNDSKKYPDTKVFLITLKNIKTNEIGLSLDDEIDYSKYIKRKKYDLSVGIYHDGIFIHDGLDSDTINIQFVNKDGSRIITNFVKD